MRDRKLYFLLKILLSMVMFSLYGKAYALYIDADISSMEADKTFFSKSYINDTKKTNLYNFSAYKIDRPGSKEHGEPITEGEIIFTPLKKILLPGEREFFKIFYRGKNDNQERYYKIVIGETPLEMQNDDTRKKKPLFYPTMSLETYFVVRPKNIDFKYDMNASEGVLKNTGNTYFRVVIHNSCQVDDEAPSMLYLLPQQEYRHTQLKKKSRKYIVIFDKYYSIGNCDYF